MDWTTISIAVAALSVIVYFIGYRFGNAAGYINGVKAGVKHAEDVFTKTVNQYLSESIEKLPKINLSEDEKNYITANIADLTTMIDQMNDPEDVVNKKSLEDQKSALLYILEKDEKEKTDV